MIQVMVTGSRSYSDYQTMRYALRKIDDLYGGYLVLLHGGAAGADTVASNVAQQLGWSIREFPADWEFYGKRAGPIRNQEMIDEQPNIVLAFPEKGSIGTWDAVRRAKKANIRVEVFQKP